MLSLGLGRPREFRRAKKESQVFSQRLAQVENLCYVKKAAAGGLVVAVLGFLRRSIGLGSPSHQRLSHVTQEEAVAESEGEIRRSRYSSP